VKTLNLPNFAMNVSAAQRSIIRLENHHRAFAADTAPNPAEELSVLP
jgi:hypothetical protein